MSSPGITYRTNHPLEVSEIQAVFLSSGIRRPTQDAARIGRMFANANLVISAWDGEKLVGVCRALTDASYCCYLSDLAVRADYQRQGIGRELVFRLHAALGEEVSLVLLSAPEAMAFYPALGFEAIGNGFILKRSR